MGKALLRQIIHEPFEKKYRNIKKGNIKAHLGSDIARTTLETPCASADVLAYRLLHRMDVTTEISLKTVYNLIELANDKNFRCRFQTNSAAKQTQTHC